MKIKCTICVYEDKMVFSFASVLENKNVENKFKEILEGKYDDLPESAFLFLFIIQEAIEKAKTLGYGMKL